MIFDFLSELNWLAVLVATIGWYALAAAWYSIPPMSKAWQRAANIEQPQGGGMAGILIATLVFYFLTTIVIGLLVKATGATTFGEGLALGAALGIAFGLLTAFVSQLYERKGSMYWLINGLVQLIAWMGVAGILAIWN
ncbi:MAG TPA: DUF1761 domain-containing protein [Actinomycetota bacterium]|nr:DUF1761 domain-containing protein [Actinomycetota bacterium]